MIASTVVRDNRRHITQADNGNVAPVLSSANIAFPKPQSLAGIALKLMLQGEALTHRTFYGICASYRFAVIADRLRSMGWPLIYQNEVMLTSNPVTRQARFNRYTLFAELTPELMARAKGFYQLINHFAEVGE